MKEKGDNTNLNYPLSNKDKKNSFPGYPAYADSDDVYSKDEEQEDINPEDISKTKELENNFGKNNEKDFNDDVSGDDLDIPGSEFDDDEEKIGNEDEENEYYSLGGDDHNDLDEDNGD
jgi:hypothetical protein